MDQGYQSGMPQQRLAAQQRMPEQEPRSHGTGPFKRTFSPENIFKGTGILLLTMLCVVPIWNAASLLNDDNYVFWAGRSIPIWLIVLSIMIILLYIVTIFAFFSYSRLTVRTEQTFMMIANIFITLLGLVLMLVSLPLSRQSIETYNNLMHRCDYSEQTHRMYEYSQVLHNIRRQPDCAKKFSVEECLGYEEAKPYTSFLKTMEADFRCSGFCYKPPVAAAAAPAPAPAKSALQLHGARNRKQHHDHITPLALNQKTMVAAADAYPPTLFSDANYKASCEGMAARDMRNFAGDIGFQTFYQGIYLVLIAIATGFLKLIGFCVRRDTDHEILGGGYKGLTGAGLTGPPPPPMGPGPAPAHAQSMPPGSHQPFSMPPQGTYAQSMPPPRA